MKRDKRGRFANTCGVLLGKTRQEKLAEAMRVAIRNGEIALTSFINKAGLGECWLFARETTHAERFRFFAYNRERQDIVVCKDNEWQKYTVTNVDCTILKFEFTP